jgi:crotonobetainyl-CoA:carnitine CoA-transferase CaiB-like acyl-CoA transferase
MSTVTNEATSVAHGVKASARAMPADALPLRPVGGGFTLLEGVRVIDLTTSVAGPLATMLLADMGAEVLKIERPVGGDDARAWGPPFLDGESLWFLSVNRNKKSVALDYSRPEGLDILHRLVRLADVVVVNLPPRVARKLKVDAKTLRSLRNELIYVSITGFGLEGERADWTCYDLIAEGYSGIMDLTGSAGEEPQKIGAPAADMLAGQDAAFAVVSALFERQRTGNGHVIDIALVDSMTRFLACRILPYLGSAGVPTRSGGKDSVIAIYQSFETADDPITLGLGSDNLWQRFLGGCRAARHCRVPGNENKRRSPPASPGHRRKDRQDPAREAAKSLACAAARREDTRRTNQPRRPGRCRRSPARARHVLPGGEPGRAVGAAGRHRDHRRWYLEFTPSDAAAPWRSYR